MAEAVDRLCAGTLTDEETHVQILKTIHLARDGRFSPMFTLQLLQQAEVLVAKNQLSPVLALKTCHHSLAFGAAVEDRSPQK